MTLVSKQTENGADVVKVLIIASTICDPHGAVDKGSVVEVTIDEFNKLLVAGKAELLSLEKKVEGAVSREVTEAHLEYMKLRGYVVEGVEGAKSFVENLREKAESFFADFEAHHPAIAELKAKVEALSTKAEVALFAKSEFDLVLPEKWTRDEMVQTILEEHINKVDLAEAAGDTGAQG